MAKRWEQLFREVNEMVSAGCINLFDQATKIREIRDDKQFSAFHGGDLDKMRAALEPLTRNLVTLNLTEILEMLVAVPDKAEWTPANMANIHARAVEAVVARRQARPPTPVEASEAGRTLLDYRHATQPSDTETAEEQEIDWQAKWREEHRLRLVAERELARVKKQLAKLFKEEAV